jgi:hypothetical protein
MLSLAMFLQDSQLDPEKIQQIQQILLPLMGFVFFASIVGMAIVIIPFWFICKKAGLSPWLSMLNLIPGLGYLVLLYILAFADWKVAPVAQTGWPPQQPPYTPQYPPQYPPQQ